MNTTFKGRDIYSGKDIFKKNCELKYLARHYHLGIL